MLRLPQFRFHLPGSIREALSILAAEGPEARVVAGGTDLWPNMKRRHQKPATVVSLMSIEELNGVDVAETSREARIGATTRLEDLVRNPDLRARFPGLARAVASISSPPLRHMGTLGGNICLDTRCTYYNQTEDWRRAIDYCMKEAGTVCWVAPSSSRCWAHTASDSAPMLCALGARLRLLSADGERVLPITELYRDDGIDYLAKQPDEVVADVLLPTASDSDHCRSSFWKLRRRGSIDFAVFSVAAAVWTDARGVVSDARIFLGAVGSQPVAVEAAAEILRGRPLTEERIAAIAQLARKLATPMDNTDFKAQWRGLMAARYTEAALREIAGLETEVLPPRHATL
jgi:4-hydroxybenzoyl-CoA reductase subunit beta